MRSRELNNGLKSYLNSSFRILGLSFCLFTTNLYAQQNSEALADNVKKMTELYGFATQLMNLGGNILNNAKTSNGKISPGGSSSSSSSISSSSSNDGGNGILGEVVRPQFRGTPNFDFEGRNNGARESGSGLAGLGALAGLGGGSNGGSLLGEYGGGPLGAGSKSQPRGILDTLMGSFLGSSIGGNGASTSSNFFSPNHEEYGSQGSRYGSSKSGSNIEALVDALSRSGAKRTEPTENDGGATSLLSQFFGGGKKR